MKRRLLQPVRSCMSPGAPRGVTLTEVLMSIMIMSIGVVTLATLFPISVMRTLQATQLTNATILRYNTEAMIHVAPDVVLNPAPDAPSRNDPRYILANYIVDPLGWNLMDPALQATFGNDGSGPSGGLLRYPFVYHQDHALFTSAADPLNAATQAARVAVTLPDSWVDYGTWTVVADMATSPTSITLSGGFDLSSVPTDGSARITLFDPSGKKSHTRPINSVSGMQVEWSQDLPLPFTAHRALIQIQEQRYTWLLTVRNRWTGPDDPLNGKVDLKEPAEVDVVVFFRRSFDPQDERLYSANFTQGSRSVFVNSAALGALRRGGYILDPTNALWYRIEGFTDQGSQIKVDLQSSIRADSNGAIVPRGVVDVYPIRPIARP